MIIDKFIKEKPCFYYYVFKYSNYYVIYRTSNKIIDVDRVHFNSKMSLSSFISCEIGSLADQYPNMRSAIGKLKQKVKSKVYKIPKINKYCYLYNGKVEGVMFLSEDE